VTGAGRLAKRFLELATANRAAFIPYIMAGDPDAATTARLLSALPGAGADIIELGFAFSDPMADGPAIQRAGLRALAGGATLASTLALAAGFRAEDAATPLILMGYANPIENMGHAAFAAAAAAAGVDGVIVVDIPPEEDAALHTELAERGVALIRLAAPTTSDDRLVRILSGARGFVYYVSVTGVTGDRAVVAEDALQAVRRVRSFSELPVAVGFGVRTPQSAQEIARGADAVVVGSLLVDRIAAACAAGQDPVAAVLEDVHALAAAVHEARDMSTFQHQRTHEATV
jgi:tryptophan synthase alpha chain